jgi:hypothetical protein
MKDNLQYPKIGEILNAMKDNSLFKKYHNDKGEVFLNPSIFERITLNKGVSLSVQASRTHYCQPRDDCDDYNYFSKFEVGYIKQDDNYFIPFPFVQFAEDSISDEIGNTIYPYVPNYEIDALINVYGGLSDDLEQKLFGDKYK